MRLLDRFPVLLLDMNGTFMFGEDRFGADADFFATYQALGGEALPREEVTRHIRHCYGGLCRLYEDPDHYDDFPSVREGFRRFTDARDGDLHYLEAVFAHHECGTVSEEFADCIHRLARTHRLALVANIWAQKDAWVRELQRAGIDACFEAHIYSSDTRSVKPSPSLFRDALGRMNATPEEALFVGDSLRCDMEGARGAGLRTVWITDRSDPQSSVDHRILTLLHLERLES